MQDNHDYIYLGKLATTHGLKGELKAYLENVQESVLKTGLKVKLKHRDSESYQTIESIRWGNFVLIKFIDINTESEAKDLIPSELYLHQEHFPALEGDEYYVKDLIGMKVQFSNRPLMNGIVSESYSNGVQEVLVITIEEKFKIELPFVSAFFTDVNVSKKLIQAIYPDYVDE